MNIDYTLWPNTNGALGQNKVAIPDGVTVQWPEGDALIGNFVYKDGLLSGFVDTAALVLNDSAATTINYDYIDIELPNIGEGDIAITRGPRSKYFNVKYGTTLIIEKEPTMLTDKEISLLKSSRKVVDNTCYDASLKNIGTVNTELIGVNNDAAGLFSERELEGFSSSLANVVDSSNMFYNARYGAELFDGTSNRYTNGGQLAVTTGYMGNLINANNMFGNVYQYAAHTASTEFAQLSLSIDKYDNASKPCKIEDITNLVTCRRIPDATTVESITNICKYAKLNSNQNIGEVQINNTIENTFINNGWTTSKTRKLEPGTEESSLYYYNDNGYWVTMDYINPEGGK